VPGLDLVTFRTLFLQLVIFLLFSSCTIGENQKADFYRNNPIALYQAALQHSKKLKTLEGYAHLTVESPEGGFDGNARIYYQEPDSLLIVVKAGPGISLGSMLVKDGRFWMYNIREKLLFQSKGEQITFDEIIGINVPLPNIFDAALGLPDYQNYQLPDDLDSNLYKIQFKDDYIQYSLKKNNRTFKFLADPKKGSFVGYSMIQEGETDTVHVVFKQFGKYKGINIPRHIQITRPSHKERLSFFYRRIKVNGKMAANRFELKIAKNVEVIDLTQGNL